jgi:hypothetical protein
MDGWMDGRRGKGTLEGFNLEMVLQNARQAGELDCVDCRVAA